MVAKPNQAEQAHKMKNHRRRWHAFWDRSFILASQPVWVMSNRLFAGGRHLPAWTLATCSLWQAKCCHPMPSVKWACQYLQMLINLPALVISQWNKIWYDQKDIDNSCVKFGPYSNPLRQLTKHFVYIPAPPNHLSLNGVEHIGHVIEIIPHRCYNQLPQKVRQLF